MTLLAESLTLAETVQRWLRRQRLDVAQVARLGGLSRPTVHKVMRGDRVSGDSLRGIAKGLASDPYTREMDPSIYAEALRELAEAADMPHLLHEAPAPPTLEDQIGRVVRNPDRAALLADFVRHYPNMTPDQRKLVDALLDSLGKP